MLDLKKSLHDLAQPLTALECRLYLATLETGDAGELRKAIEDGLRECSRMMTLVREMQAGLHETGDGR